MTKWLFTDPTDASTYHFEINPNDGGSPQYAKNIASESAVAPGGATLFFEGAAQTQDFSFSGTILSQSQYNAMVTWFTKKHPVTVTDDLGRTFNIYIKTFSPKRVRSTNFWKHTYECTSILLP